MDGLCQTKIQKQINKETNNQYDLVILGMSQFLDYNWDSDEDFEESTRQGKEGLFPLPLYTMTNMPFVFVNLKVTLSGGGVRGSGRGGGRGAGQGGREGGRGAGQGGREGGRGAGQGGRGGGQGCGGAGRGRGGGGTVVGSSQVAGPSRDGRGAEQAGRGEGRGAAGQAGGLPVVQGGRGGGRGDGAGDQAVGRGGRGRGGRGRWVRARAWVFTINNYVGVPTADFLRGPGHPPIKYLCYGREVSDNGTPHLQGYVAFENAVAAPSQHFRQFGNGRFEVARGTADDNAEYCAKEGDFHELGVRPQSTRDQGHHGARGGDVEVVRWEDAWKSAKEGKIEEIPADIRLRHYTTILKIAAKYQKPPAQLLEMDNTWIWGPAGTGKSTYAHKTYPGAFKKDFSRWWDGFREDDEGHLTVLLDDLHPSWSDKVRLKNWADVFPFVAEIKGGSLLIRPARIVVTSNYSPQQV